MAAAALARATRARDQAGHGLSELAPALVSVADAAARRLASGATLLATGTGLSAVDAAHVAVEFIHPVIVGKRSIPALAGDPESVAASVGDGDVVLGIDLADGSRTARALGRARRRGAHTIALTADPARVADHRLVVSASDPLVARESHVTCYHLLWELVHEHLDAGGTTGRSGPGGLAELYPFLYDRPSPATGLTEALTASTAAKVAEVRELRARALEETSTLAEAAALLRRCRDRRGRVWTFGNGGSSTDAQAAAFVLRDPGFGGEPIPARALTDDVATVTALANDVRFEVVFARMIESLARPGDVAIGFSTSGTSANVLAGLEQAHAAGVATIGLAGYDGGSMAHLPGLGHLLVVPSSSVHRIQEVQTTLLHVLAATARRS